jgi:hypothetical protein
LTIEDFRKHFEALFAKLRQNLFGRLDLITGADLRTLLQEVSDLYSNEENVKSFLIGLMQKTASFTLKG